MRLFANKCKIYLILLFVEKFPKSYFVVKRNINITLGYKANTENNLNATMLLVTKCKT